MAPSLVGRTMTIDKNSVAGNVSRRCVIATCASALITSVGATAPKHNNGKSNTYRGGNIVSLSSFGVIGSLAADAAHEDQTEKIQAALDHLDSSAPGGVLIVNGWYAVAGLIIPPNVSLIGKSQSASGFIKFGTLHKPMLSLAPSAAELLFQDLSIDGRSGGEPQPLLALGTDGGSSTTFSRVTFQNGCARAAVRGDWGSPQHDLRFEDCRFTNLPGGGVQLLPTIRGSNNIFFEDNLFEVVGGSAICIHHGGATGDAEFGYNKEIYLRRNHFVSPLLSGINGDPIPVEIWGWDGGECVDNDIVGGTRGLSAGAGSRGILYARNRIANQTRYAFECGKMRSCTFQGNVAVDCPSMFAFTGGGEEGFDVFDVTIINNRGYGTGLHAPAKNIDYVSGSNEAPVARNLRIVNNRFFDLEYVRSVVRFLASQGSPIVTIDGDGTGATATVTLRAVGGRVVDPGTGYATPPEISVFGGGGAGAAFECSLGSGGAVAEVWLTASGSGYRSAPTLTVKGGGGHGAVIDASMGVDEFQILDSGSGYTKANVTVTNNGGCNFKGLVQLSSGSVVGVKISGSGQGFGRSSTICVEGNQYVARTYNSCANGYYIDGANVIVSSNLWRRSAMFDIRHYQGGDAVAYRQPTINARPQPLLAFYKDNVAEMLGQHHTGTLISFGVNSQQPLSSRIQTQEEVRRGPFSKCGC
jgi:hypothetical protein